MYGANIIQLATLSCAFGTVASTGVTWLSATSVACASPAATSGSVVLVSVTVNGADYSNTLSLQYYRAFRSVLPLIAC